MAGSLTPTTQSKGLSPLSKRTATTTAECRRRTASGSSVDFSWHWVKSDMSWKRNGRLVTSSRFIHDLSSFTAVLLLTGLLPSRVPLCFDLLGKDTKLFPFGHPEIWPIETKYQISSWNMNYTPKIDAIVEGRNERSSSTQKKQPPYSQLLNTSLLLKKLKTIKYLEKICNFAGWENSITQRLEDATWQKKNRKNSYIQP